MPFRPVNRQNGKTETMHPLPSNDAQISRSGIAKLVFILSTNAHTGVVKPDSIQLNRTNAPTTIRYFDVKAVETRPGWFWDAIKIQTHSAVFRITALNRQDAARFAAYVEASWIGWSLALLEHNADAIDRIYRQTGELSDPPQYIRNHIFNSLITDAQSISKLLPHSWPTGLLTHDLVQKLSRIRRLIEDVGTRERANKAFVENELSRSRHFLDTVESKPLTEEQRKAVVVDEDRNLVVAAAGSGKTSVIVAKAGWLINRNYRRQSELLLLAYAKDAQIEMEDRLKQRLGQTRADGIKVKTFHSLGLSIIGEATGKRPSLSKVAEDSTALIALLRSLASELLSSQDFSKAMVTWFQSYFAPYKSNFDFENLGQYWNYVRQFEIRSLKGDRVKSYEECEIANFLFLNGVPYEYERPYEHDTATPDRRQYQPDFYLTQANVYLEHFALTAEGTTPSFIDKNKYLSSIQWKRELHQKNGTKLIETYSHEKSSGVLLDQLASKLASHGVVLESIAPESLFSALEEQGRIDPFTGLVATFLQHFKGGQLRVSDLVERASRSPDRPRAAAFIKVFGAIYQRYEDRLKETRQIDFNDMISLATEHVESGRYISPYGYILVDEFQDISQGRARLLKALLSQSSSHQLFAVGDDWQAIYRFAGSDIAIMREFSQSFGVSERVNLETTFRCVEEISSAASRFVLQNPGQIAKTVRSTGQANCPSIYIGLPDEDETDTLRASLDRISADAAKTGSRASVLLIGRYRHSRPKNFATLARSYASLNLDYMTVHRSKGLEADYVIVLDLCAGRLGFPAEIADDPLLDLVLAAPEPYPNAEERRLFYVALTRARKQVYLLADKGTPSTFIQELLRDRYDIAVLGKAPEQDASCPKCIEGRMHRRSGPHGTFYGCTNFPYCDHTQSACPHCSTGLPLKRHSKMTCSNCQADVMPCPQCGGWLRVRSGRFGQFFGCVNFPLCNYTRNIEPESKGAFRQP